MFYGILCFIFYIKLSNKLVSAQLVAIPENLELTLNDPCVLLNNERGICTKDEQCQHAIELIKAKKVNEIVRCSFIGLRPLICCPTSIPDVSEAIARRESKKFRKALCKDRKPKTQNSDVETFLVGSAKADVAEFPFQVVFVYLNKQTNLYEFDCGGSLIADDIVLTAAHCVNKKDRRPEIVRIGKTSLDPQDDEDDSIGQDIKIRSIKVHPAYSTRSKQNDIAIVKLRQPVDFGDNVNTICISSDEERSSDNFTVTGYGVMNAIKNQKSPWLLKANIMEIPLEKCHEDFRNYNVQITDNQICSTPSIIDACQGDSGGPMFHENNNVKYLFGIISHGDHCDSGFPAVYTKVNRYLDWLEDEMSLLE